MTPWAAGGMVKALLAEREGVRLFAQALIATVVAGRTRKPTLLALAVATALRRGPAADIPRPDPTKGDPR